MAVDEDGANCAAIHPFLLSHLAHEAHRGVKRSDERMQDGIDGGVGQKQAARRGWIAAQLAPSSSTASIIPAPVLQMHFPPHYGGRRTE